MDCTLQRKESVARPNANSIRRALLDAVISPITAVCTTQPQLSASSTSGFIQKTYFLILIKRERGEFYLWRRIYLILPVTRSSVCGISAVLALNATASRRARSTLVEMSIIPSLEALTSAVETVLAKLPRRLRVHRAAAPWAAPCRPAYRR